MAIKSMIRLNQVKDQSSEFAAHAPDNLQSAYPSSADGLDGLEFTLINLHESLHKRFGSGVIPAGNSLFAPAGGAAAGVVAQFADADQVAEVLIQQGYTNNAAKLKLLSDAENSTDAIFIHAAGSNAQMLLQADTKIQETAPTVELEGSTEVIVDSPILSLEDDASRITFGSQDDVTLLHGGNASGTLSGSGAGSLNLDFDTSVNIDSASGAINIGADTDTGAINVGSGASARTITVGNDASTKVDVNALAIELDSAGTILLDSVSTTDIDAAGALSLNSSGAAINIGDDAIAQPINIGSSSAARTITIGHDDSTKVDVNAIDIELDAASGVLMTSVDEIVATAGAVLTLSATTGQVDLKGDAGGAAQSTIVSQNDGAGALSQGNGDPIDGFGMQLDMASTGTASEAALSLINMAGEDEADYANVSASTMIYAGAGGFLAQAAKNMQLHALGMEIYSLGGSANASESDVSNGGAVYGSDSMSALNLPTSDAIWFKDVHSTTWSDSRGIPLALCTTEYSEYETAFGEVSLLNALLKANSGGTSDSGRYEGVLAGGIAVTNFFEPASGMLKYIDSDAGTADFGSAIDLSQDSFASSDLDEDELLNALEVYVNGQKMRCGIGIPASNGHAALADHDVVVYDGTSTDIATATVAYTGGTGAQSFKLVFQFNLEEDDVICVKVG